MMPRLAPLALLLVRCTPAPPGQPDVPLRLPDPRPRRLVVVDPDTLEERLVAEHVAATSLHRSEVPGSTALDIGDSVVDGARSGVWLARLPAPE